MKERLFTLLVVLVLFVAGLRPSMPSAPLGGFMTPLVGCQDSNQCGG